MLNKAIVILILALCGSFVPASAQDSYNIKAFYKTIYVGVLTFPNEKKTIQRWQPLVDYLNKVIESNHFELIVGNYKILEQKIAQNKLSFLLTHPSHYVALTHRYNLSSPLVSILSKADTATGGGYSVLGGVIFTLSNRDDINILADIKNKLIATPTKKSLGSYQAQVFELMAENIISRPQQLNLLKTGLPHTNAIEAVLSGKADVGFVRTGVLEKEFNKQTLLPEQIKIINPQNVADFSLLISTRFYPEWPFAAFSHVNRYLTEEVAIALLAVNYDSPLAYKTRTSGFTIAEDYLQIDKLLQKLRLPPFDQQLDFSFSDVWQQWQGYIIVFTLLIVSGLLLLSFRLLNRNQALVKSQKELHTSHQQVEKLSLAVDQSPIRIIITNIKNEIEYVNKAVIVQSGYSFEELLTKKPNIFSSGETSGATFKILWKTILQGKMWSGDLVNLTKQGQKQVFKTTITPIKDSNQKVTGFLSIQRDITQEQQDQQEIYRLAFSDQLTGLANRALLEKRINEGIAQDFHNKTCHLVLINIDRFKVINNANGKEMGDLLLKQVAERLSSFVSHKDLLSRLSGDEFTVFIVDIKSVQEREVILQKIKDIQQAFKTPFIINASEISITISIGIDSFDATDKLTLNDIFKHADMALHYAKSRGGNQLQVFNKSLKERAVEHFEIEQDLKIALTKKQFILFYQPQVDLQGKLAGVEALIRWQHPTKGMLGPYRFIEIAEQSDLIVDIGSWVLNEACQKMALASKKGFYYHLSVNISPRQFMKANFFQQVQQVVKQTGVNPKNLTLEITEGLFVNDLQDILSTMQQLAKIGIKFSIDDFGTGYSSLSYLKLLPVNELKIDRAFIKDLTVDKKDKALVETILAIAEHMGFSVVAEGVETLQQAKFFRDYAPDTIIQGFLYAKPMSFEDLYEKWHH